MKLINTGTKIINIGDKILMPGETMPIDKELAYTPAIRAFAEKRLLSIDDSDDKFREAVEAEAKRIAAEEAAKKATGETGALDKENGSVESGGKPGEGGEDKRPLYRMNKGELLAECKRLGIEVSPDDTNPDLVEKIKAVTAE